MKRFEILIVLVLLFCTEFQLTHAFPGGKKDKDVSGDLSGETNEESKEVSLEESHEESAQKDTSRSRGSFKETSEGSSKISPEISTESSFKAFTKIPTVTSFDGPQDCGEKPDLYDEPCAYCECISETYGSWHWECFLPECWEARCVDGYKPEGECCVKCPNGPNCLYNDRIIKVGKSFLNDAGESCTCLETDIWFELPEVQCD